MIGQRRGLVKQLVHTPLFRLSSFRSIPNHSKISSYSLTFVLFLCTTSGGLELFLGREGRKLILRTLIIKQCTTFLWYILYLYHMYHIVVHVWYILDILYRIRSFHFNKFHFFPFFFLGFKSYFGG